MITTILLILFGFVIGTIMGSFGGVLLDRWENLTSMLTGRSMCLDCKHPLAPKDLIPLISYLSTGGKCRYCGTSIPVSCPVLELIMGTVFALTSWWIASIGGDTMVVDLIVWWLINRTLTLIIIHDHNTHYLHWTAWVIGSILAIGYTIIQHPDMPQTTLISSVILGGVFGIIYGCGRIIHRIKYGTWSEGFGLGDVLTALIIGWLAPLALGYEQLNLIGESGILTFIQLILGYLVISSSIGLLYRAYLRSRGTKEIEIAFIPGMVLGFWLYCFIVIQFNLFVY